MSVLACYAHVNLKDENFSGMSVLYGAPPKVITGTPCTHGDIRVFITGHVPERLWDAQTGRLSVQVLQEFFVTVTRKVAKPLDVDEAAELVRDFTAWPVFAPTADDVLGAIALQRKSRYSFWDAMILHAAAESGCAVCWSEDMRDGQVVRGVRVTNPFA